TTRARRENSILRQRKRSYHNDRATSSDHATRANDGAARRNSSADHSCCALLFSPSLLVIRVSPTEVAPPGHGLRREVWRLSLRAFDSHFRNRAVHALLLKCEIPFDASLDQS